MNNVSLSSPGAPRAARRTTATRRWPRLLAAVALLAIGGSAAANDRPFASARTAVSEEDDAQTWSFESWVQRYGGVRGFSIEPEYTFTPSTSVQLELTRRVDRAGDETGHEAEVEFKHLFNAIARDGWGWGISASLAAERSRGSERTTRSLTVKLPFSLALWDGAGYLHVNAGITKANDAPRAWDRSIAIEREVLRRTHAFAEYARDGDSRFAQAGLRYWVQREKVAIDFALQQQRSEGRKGSGFILGVGLYDW